MQKRDFLNLPKQKSIIYPASYFKRITAFLIDLFIVYFIVGYPLNKLLKRLLPKSISITDYFNFLINPNLPTIILVVIAALEILTIIYFIILEYKLNQSIGKMVMKIFVVSDTKELKLWQLIVRSLFLLADIILIFDVIYCLFNREKRRFLEILSKTRTIEKHLA